jgi:formyltetrahydrofolate synthetase
MKELEREEIQLDGRVRRWKRIVEADGRALRVIFVADKATINNTFFDRDYREPSDESQVF